MIHSILKRSTNDFHKALEVKLRVLLSADISLDQYASVHKKFFGFYRPIEERLFSIRRWDDPELQLEDRLKTPLLIDDLACLDVDHEKLAGYRSVAHFPVWKPSPRRLAVCMSWKGQHSEARSSPHT